MDFVSLSFPPPSIVKKPAPDGEGRDVPLGRRWNLNGAEIAKLLDLPMPLSEFYARAREAILLDALMHPGRWISYPRRKVHYTRNKRYPPCQ
jgi:hypothetical protein